MLNLFYYIGLREFLQIFVLVFGLGNPILLRSFLFFIAIWMKTSIKNLIFFSVFLLIGSGLMVHGRNYPVSEIQGKFCQNQECTIPLPILHGANYFNYINNPLYRRIYSVLWGGTYFGGRDFGLGAHKGIDITSRK